MIRSVDRLGDEAWEVLYRDDEGHVAWRKSDR
jgi:hypothetical protein